jgi:hypothetical protein
MECHTLTLTLTHIAHIKGKEWACHTHPHAPHPRPSAHIHNQKK